MRNVIAIHILLGCLPYHAAEAALDARLDVQPRALALGDSATATIQIRGVSNPPAPTLPAIDGFQVQFLGSEQNMSWINGVQDSSVTFKFRLFPQRVGSLTVGPFTYAAGRERADLAAVALDVVAASGSRETKTWNDLIFARLSVPATNLYHQQVFDVVLSLYTAPQVNLDRNISLLNLPSQGLSFQPFQELQSGREVVGREVFDVRRFRCKATALTAGTFALEPVLRVNLLVPRERRGGGVFDDPFMDSFFGGRTATQPYDVQVPATSLVVHSLPENGRPDHFSGAVGRFQFEVEARPLELRAGDPVTLTLKISGEGNVDAVSAPTLKLGEDFKVYDARLVNQEGGAEAGIGSKTFEQVVIPRTTAANSLPALAFSYFNPLTERYETIVRGPYSLVVKEGASATVVQAPAVSPETAGAALLGSDLQYLKPAPTRWVRLDHKPWYARPVWVGLQAFPPLALALVWSLARRREKFAKDVSLARRHQAPKAARAALQRARAAASAGNAVDYHEAIWSALADYFGHRLNLAPGEVEPARVLAALRAAGLAEADGVALGELFHACEQMRYAPGAAAALSPVESDADLNRVQDLLQRCERLRL